MCAGPFVSPYRVGDLETDVALARVSLGQVRSHWPQRDFLPSMEGRKVMKELRPQPDHLCSTSDLRLGQNQTFMKGRAYPRAS
jgi:hypothetical protein